MISVPAVISAACSVLTLCCGTLYAQGIDGQGWALDLYGAERPGLVEGLNVSPNMLPKNDWKPQQFNLSNESGLGALSDFLTKIGELEIEISAEGSAGNGAITPEIQQLLEDIIKEQSRIPVIDFPSEPPPLEGPVIGQPTNPTCPDGTRLPLYCLDVPLDSGCKCES